MHNLISHPDTPPKAILGVAVAAERLGDDLHLRYDVVGQIDVLRLSPPGLGRRTNDLWRTTCLEAFLRPADEDGYREFNFSPSGDWAAYGFSGYRAGMAMLEMAPPPIAAARFPDRFTLSTAVSVTPGRQRLSLTTILEEKDGTKSYWALAHPPGKPDFHHDACFALELPALA